MNGPQVLVGGPAGPRGEVPRPNTEAAWGIIGLTSWALVVVGGVDLGLSIFPARFGAPDWEFGTASRVLDNLPLFTVGVMLQAASAIALGRVTWFRFLSWLMPLAVMVVVVAIVLFGLALPLALQQVTEPDPRLLLQKAAAKTLVQAVAYTVLFAGVFVTMRRARR